MRRFATSLILIASLLGLLGQTSSVFASTMDSQMGMTHSEQCIGNGCLSLPEACADHCVDQKREHITNIAPIVKQIISANLPEKTKLTIPSTREPLPVIKTAAHRDIKRILTTNKRE